METTARCVCLDAEFVEGDELIELSIYSLDRTEIYHGLYRPRRYRKWDSSIHHITPEMVKDSPFFDDVRAQVQRIIDSADYIMGFALENDISHLSRQGIENLEKKQIVELRDWFWINHGQPAGMDLYQGVSLASVTEHLGVKFGEEGMHSATGDTLATLDSFLALYNRFCTARGLDAGKFELAVQQSNDLYATEKEAYDRNHAEGYAMLIRVGEDGYALRVRREQPVSMRKVAACIRVADRKRAEVELHNLISRRPMTGREVYRLTPKDIEKFEAYSNNFDAEDSLYFNKLQKLSRNFHVSGLKRR